MDFFTLFFVWKHLSSQAYWSLGDNSGMQIGFSIAQWTRHAAGTGCHTGLCDNANGKFCLENPPSKDSISQCTSVLGADFKRCYRDLIFRDQASCTGYRLSGWCLRNMSFFPLRLGSVLMTKHHHRTQQKTTFLHWPKFKCLLACQVRETLLLSSF